MERLRVSRLPLEENLYDLLEVPLELQHLLVPEIAVLDTKQVFDLRILDKQDEGAEEFAICIAWILVLLHDQVLKVVAAQIQEKLSDALW